MKKLFAVSFFLLSSLVICQVSANSRDSLYVFKFPVGQDGFYSLYRDNGKELARLYGIIEQHKSAILNGEIPIYVNGYCQSLASEKDNLRTAKVRANRVKTELIIGKGIKENHFVTKTLVGTFDGSQDGVTVALLVKEKAVEVAEVPTKQPEPVVVKTEEPQQTAPMEPVDAPKPAEQAQPIAQQPQQAEQPKQATPPQTVKQTKTIETPVAGMVAGEVIEADTDDPLAGVIVRKKGTSIATVTDENGMFKINAKAGEILEFSMMSFQKTEKKITANQQKMTIKMRLDATMLKEVEVVNAGIINHNRQGFTGAAAQYTTEDLKNVGNTNVLQSLKSLDPAFVIVENLEVGSDPNALPNIEIRGQTSFAALQDDASAASSNLPLFILDGFEATLEEFNDLDINRVASVTILKDAGSTAIYGSKGANGVIVIETIRPKAGQLFLSYSGDYQIATPDLSVYNMMNAEEKLKFELYAGRYTTSLSDQNLYYEKLRDIKSGVDTYWLSVPVQVAFSQNHSVTLSGGSNDLQYSVGVNYKNNVGVMKDENHDAFGGNVRLIYRGIKGLSVQNNLYVTGSNGHAGSWGSFENFVNANPYYSKTYEDGTIPKYLDSYSTVLTTFTSVNPLYNAQLFSRTDNNAIIVTNTTSIDWTVFKGLLIRGGLSLRSSNGHGVSFLDPRNSSFDNYTYDKKGSYSSTHSNSWSYNANVSANYMQSFDAHNFTLILRSNIEDQHSESESLSVVGFPEGSKGYPTQAFSYPEGQRPGYSSRVTRNLGALGAFNYNYNWRYLFDFTYNLDGSTNFGSKRRFQPFWSTGVGWNIHREPFVKSHAPWLDELKLRATYGINGNMSGSFVTTSIYEYQNGSNFFGQSSAMTQKGNQYLEWQIVKNISGGVDLSLLNNDLRVNMDVYKKLADPLVISLRQQASSGVATYTANMGYLQTVGYEFRANYNIINNKRKNLLLGIRLTGGYAYSTYGGFGNALAELNAKAQSGGVTSLASLSHYQDGTSPNDLWAVRSLGIDPATGREIFLTKNGERTYDYSSDDQIIIANTRPDIQGTIGLNFRYKKLQFNTNLRYYLGAYRYNSAVYTKVENISSQNIVFNQDRRALYDRWKEVGDIAQYRSVTILTTTTTPVSSRFIQKDNYLRGESFRLSWNFTGDKWLKTFGMEDLTVGISMVDFFNLYSIKIERGITDPFQRSISLNVSTRF